MDRTMETVSRLYDDGQSIRNISRRLGISQAKVRKILISTGQHRTPLQGDVEERMRKMHNAQAVADAMKIAVNTVWSNLPYKKGIYGAECPSINALRIRKTREKQEDGKDG